MSSSLQFALKRQVDAGCAVDALISLRKAKHRIAMTWATEIEKFRQKMRDDLPKVPQRECTIAISQLRFYHKDYDMFVGRQLPILTDADFDPNVP